MPVWCVLSGGLRWSIPPGILPGRKLCPQCEWWGSTVSQDTAFKVMSGGRTEGGARTSKGLALRLGRARRPERGRGEVSHV